MATGTAGSSLQSELNRLNGVTTPSSMRDAAGAANVYAGTTGRDLIAALNIKASGSRQPNAFKGLNAVCNEIAGTTDKSATDALRSISV